ncbi:MAG: class I SAM-dependent methyltransferase [bacterium]|nr:class I SAM-dependent methyltransferase [bacterium]
MSSYDARNIKTFYNEYGIKEWERWDKSIVQKVRFEIHLYYLKSFLESDNRILEVGAGPGRFTIELAQISNKLVIADISSTQLNLNKENAIKMGFERAVEKWVECDICDMTQHFDDDEFDAVVCYGGPLSYVFEEREKALKELLRVIKPRGFLFLGVMSLWGSCYQFFSAVLETKPEVNRKIIATGDINLENYPDTKHHFHMFRAEELCDFLANAGVSVEVISASNCLTARWDEYLSTIEENTETWEHMLEMELMACRESGCLDMGTHLIAVCRKQG